MTSSTATDHRKSAEGHVRALIALLAAQPQTAEGNQLIAECSSLASAIGAFHMEGIRFRMFNVDRALARGLVTVPDEARRLFADARRHLEAAGFQTRSHQAPDQKG